MFWKIKTTGYIIFIIYQLKKIEINIGKANSSNEISIQHEKLQELIKLHKSKLESLVIDLNLYIENKRKNDKFIENNQLNSVKTLLIYCENILSYFKYLPIMYGACFFIANKQFDLAYQLIIPLIHSNGDIENIKKLDNGVALLSLSNLAMDCLSFYKIFNNKELHKMQSQDDKILINLGSTIVQKINKISEDQRKNNFIYQKKYLISLSLYYYSNKEFVYSKELINQIKTQSLHHKQTNLLLKEQAGMTTHQWFYKLLPNDFKQMLLDAIQ